GIDLGTTNSVAAYWKGRRPRVIENEYAAFTPSVVWIENGIERVGRDAKDRLETGSPNIIFSIKRFMGVDYEDNNAQVALKSIAESLQIRKSDSGEVEVLLDGGYYSPVQISAMILKQVKRDAEIKLGEEVTHAVITVPAYFGQRQKNATREAGRLAGLIVSRSISEPTAAALAFGIDEEIDEPQDILVYDMGGGTFDVSILSVIDNNFDVLNSGGDRFLGGDDFDNLLVAEMLEHLRREYRVDLEGNRPAKMRLKSLAEKAKIELSRKDEARVIGDAITHEHGRPVNLNMTITRAHFEALIAPKVDESIEIVKRALEGAGIRPGDLDRVLLVGGSTRVPLVRQRLKDMFGDRIEIDVDPMQCVALGAAAQTAFLPEDELQGSIDEQSISPVELAAMSSPVIIEKAADLPMMSLQDMLSKYIGVETEGGEIVTVMSKGTLYPTPEPFRRPFQTNRFGQQVYELPIYESEVEDAPKESWEWIGLVHNDRLPAGLPISDVMVEMSIDSDGILWVASYLKNDPLRDDPEKGTLKMRSFRFGGQDQTKGGSNDPIEDIRFLSFMFDVIAHSFIKKYLHPEHITSLESLIRESEEVVGSEDKARAQVLLEKMEAQRAQLPVPVEDLFWASVISNNNEVVSPVERSQVQQEISQIEASIARGDADTVNRHLRQLREKIDEMFAKYPSNLLMKK
ncbi:MAG: Hsp70 family protein, partial [Chloroflexi bacterium]|nr:Hsp70 family protein [Chloroflexota bacterium]